MNASELLRSKPDPSAVPVLRTKLENEIRNWTAFIDRHGIRPE